MANLGVEQKTITDFRTTLKRDGKVLIPQIKVKINNEVRYFSLLSTKTQSSITDILTGVQGQLIDRTAETILKQENEKINQLKPRSLRKFKEKIRNLKKFPIGLQNICHPKFMETFLRQNLSKRTTISEKS